ncbi:MAG: 2-C-methyl-D-erythritol 4-phosphate cytidylyltransferase [Candidatus Omnitrophota bacterium]
MFVSAIVVAAGKGKRLGSRASKPALKLNSRPIISFSLDVLNKHPWIKEIIVVANPGNIRALGAIIRRDKPRKEVKLVLGGKERKDSVAQGLKALNPRAELVLIHDAARPFITGGLVASVIKEARKSKAAILGVAVKPTIKRCRVQGTGCRVKETIDRRNIREIQTPQVFQKELILDAYKKYGRRKVTDDAMLVEKLGKPVSIVPGSSLNIKITTPEDLIIAKGIAGWKPA